ASTVVTGRNSSVLKVSLAARQCQRLRSTKVSIRSRSSACSRLVSTERPHRNLTVPRNRGSSGLPTRWSSSHYNPRTPLLRVRATAQGSARARRSPHSEGTAQTITSCGSHHFESPPREVMIDASIADDQRQKSLNRCGDSSV